MEGRDKLLEDIDGEPLLSLQIRRALAAHHPVLVALPREIGPRREIAERHGVAIVEIADPGNGMSRSIAELARAAELRNAERLLLHLADMPEIEASDLATLLAEALSHPRSVVRAATEDGRPGHPVVFPARLFPDLQRLTGDVGARDVINAAKHVHLVPLRGNRAAVDLDTPSEWSAWRSART